ncbi:MbtH family protein [Kosakonia cowanii]|uniref:MbtH family protein n=1 Tax=Kosakonia cowanii TaxID=208223 RepID=UPI0023F77761|nr:MbtH family protein [Kosakonia cowanii]MDF7759296.1 MbtH family protein [Kosakonia cowanii]
MSNPFENESLIFTVLVNQENQHALWPEFIQIPDGWEPTFGPAARAECLQYIEQNWTDIKPRSLQNR